VTELRWVGMNQEEKRCLCGDFLRLKRKGKVLVGFTFQRPRVNKRIQAREAEATQNEVTSTLFFQL
jgi:hypothetical protein